MRPEHVRLVVALERARHLAEQTERLLAVSRLCLHEVRNTRQHAALLRSLAELNRHERAG